MENMYTDVKMRRVEHNVPKILIAVMLVLTDLYDASHSARLS